MQFRRICAKAAGIRLPEKARSSPSQIATGARNKTPSRPKTKWPKSQNREVRRIVRTIEIFCRAAIHIQPRKNASSNKGAIRQNCPTISTLRTNPSGGLSTKSGEYVLAWALKPVPHIYRSVTAVPAREKQVIFAPLALSASVRRQLRAREILRSARARKMQTQTKSDAPTALTP